MFGVVSVVDFAIQLLVSSAFEGEYASQTDEGQHPQCPDVSWFASVLPLLDDFWGHITGCAAEELDLFLRLNACAEPEVDQLGGQTLP